jgi:hypothetical protein
MNRAQPPRVIRGLRVVLLAACCLAVLASPVMSASGLQKGSVTPRSGTTATTFTFRVEAAAGKPPSSVTARLTRAGGGTRTVALSHAGKTWTGSSRVTTTGTWTVTFVATPTGTTTGGTITVSPAPTPRPTPVATPPPPAATPRATAAATRRPTASPARSSRSTAATASGRPPSTPTAVGGATQPSSAPGAAAGGTGGSGPLLPAIVLGLFVILGVGGIALLTGRREAEERPSPAPGGLPPENPPDPDFVRRAASVGAADGEAKPARARPRAAWEMDSALDNQPLGTANGSAAEEPREDLASGATDQAAMPGPEATSIDPGEPQEP